MSNELRGGEEPLAQRGAAGVLDVADHLVLQQRPELDEVAVGVDDRMIDLAADPGRDGLLDPERRSFVHTGRLSLAHISGGSCSPRCALLAADDPEQAKQLEVVFAGSLTDEERRALAAPDLAGTVRFVGWLGRPRALALQRAADALLVVTGGAERRSVATGKLFEYLASGRPILVLGDETEAARIVAETGSGLSAPASNPRAIADALRRVLEAPSAGPNADAVAAYAYPVLAGALAETIDTVVSRQHAAADPLDTVECNGG